MCIAALEMCLCVNVNILDFGGCLAFLCVCVWIFIWWIDRCLPFNLILVDRCPVASGIGSKFWEGVDRLEERCHQHRRSQVN